MTFKRLFWIPIIITARSRLFSFVLFISIIFMFFIFPIIKVSADISCSTSKEVCIESQNETEYIENVPYNLGCKKYRVTYECKEKSDNNCQQLRDKGCSQIGAKCKVMLKDTCVVQDETYNCPIKKCDMKEVSCGKDIFCANGNCAPSNPTKAKDKDLEKALAYLSSVSEMANQVKEQNDRNFVIFAGRKMECSRNILPGATKDCCADNEGIFRCTDEEKELYQMRRAGRAIEVGKYCHTKVLECLSHHTAYCVFGSRIARIIQNDGRRNQLGISFGYVNDDKKSDYVDCRGITKDELTRMKFDQMDFSELYNELKKEAEKRAPKKEALKQKADGYTYDDLKT